jgi:hypothetical protein
VYNFAVKIILSSLLVFTLNLGFARETEERVRANILLRLPGLILWPEHAELNDPKVSYRLCIYRDREYYNFIREYLKSQTVRGRSIDVRYSRKLEDLRDCHISYVGEISRAGVSRILELDLVKDTIFVASSEYSAAMGLHLRLYVGELQTVEMEVNQQAFAHSGSEIRVALLKSAKKVYGRSNTTQGVAPQGENR